jgi:hypothetical protein
MNDLSSRTVGVAEEIVKLTATLASFDDTISLLPISGAHMRSVSEPILLGQMPALESVVSTSTVDTTIHSEIADYLIANINVTDRYSSLLIAAAGTDISVLTPTELSDLRASLMTTFRSQLLEYLAGSLPNAYDFSTLSADQLTTVQQQSLINYGASVVGAPGVVLDALGEASDTLTVSQIQDLTYRAVKEVIARGGSDNIVVSQVPRSVTDFVLSIFPSMSRASFASMESFYNDRSGYELRAVNDPVAALFVANDIPAPVLHLLKKSHPALLVGVTTSEWSLVFVSGNVFQLTYLNTAGVSSTVFVFYLDSKGRGADYTPSTDLTSALSDYHALINTVYSWVFHPGEGIKMSIMAMRQMGIEGINTGKGYMI